MPDKEPPRLWLRDCQVHLCKSIRQLKEFLSQGESKPRINLDFETDSLNAFDCNIVGTSIGWNGYEGIYIPTGHLTGTQLNLDPDEMWAVLGPVLRSKTIQVFGWHFEGNILPRFGVETDDYCDMMPVMWLDDMDQEEFGLKLSAKTHLGLDVIEIEEVPGSTVPDGKRKPKIEFANTHPEDAVWYGVQDVILQERLRELKYEEVRLRQGTPNAPGFIVQVENRMMGVANRMMARKVRIDREFLKRALPDALAWQKLCGQRLHAKLNDPDINLDSNQVVAKKLEQLGVPLPRTKPTKKAPEGNPSTEAKAIAVMRKVHPQWEFLFDDLDLFRSLGKDAGTYIERLLSATTDENPFIRVKFNVCGAPTGRMSSGGASDRYDDGFVRLNSQAIPATHDLAVFDCWEVQNPNPDETQGPGHNLEDWTGWKG